MKPDTIAERFSSICTDPAGKHEGSALCSGILELLLSKQICRSLMQTLPA